MLLAPAASAAPRYVPGEALVRYERGTEPGERAAARDHAGARLEDVLGLPRTQLVTFDGPVRSAVARLERQPGVADAQPNYRYRALATAPNDTFFGQLWGLGSTPGVSALSAWDRTRGSGQVIAVVDTGVDLTHPDLSGNLWANPGEVANGLDDDGNGRTDDVHGYDFVQDDGDPDDFHFHGTHVAGTAAAVADNGQGVAGVAPQAQIMAVRALDGDGNGSSLSIADSVAYAASEGAGVINLSVGGPAGAGDTVVGNAVTLAGQRGAVVVAAAGNESNDNDLAATMPCNLSHPNLICVAAIGHAGALAGYSNFGLTSVDVGAPGGDTPGQEIVSAKPSWGAPVFSEGFEAGTGDWTASTVSGLAWGQANIGAGSAKSAADSPTTNYQNNTNSKLEKTSAISLAGKRGCRMHFDIKYDIEPPDPDGSFFDVLRVRAVTGDPGVQAGLDFAGSSAGEAAEMTISELDGRPDVRPSLQFSSDGTVVSDGAYVDNINVFCRDTTYDDEAVAADDFELAAAGGGSYMAISGTSMAAPHVAGVAALVRAADPNVPAAQVVQAIKSGSTPLASLSGKTVTGGAVNAVGAIAAALALPNEPVSPGPIVPFTRRVPGQARFRGRLRADRRGRITVRIKGDAETRALLTIRATATRASATRSVVIARTRFRIGAAAEEVVRFRLRRAGRRLLSRRRTLRARAEIILRNTLGGKSTTRKRVRIALRR